MGQKSKNAGKKKHAPPKAKVSCIPKDTAFRLTDTPEAHRAFRELLSLCNTDLKGKKCSHAQRNYNFNVICGDRIPIDD